MVLWHITCIASVIVPKMLVFHLKYANKKHYLWNSSEVTGYKLKVNRLVSRSVNGRAVRKVNTTNKLTNFKNVTLIYFVIVYCVKVNDFDWESYLGYPSYPGSGWKVSEKSKSDFFIFFFCQWKYKEKTFWKESKCV